MRSVIKTRRRNIGQASEYVNNDPAMESFTLSLEESNALSEQLPAPQPSPDLPLLVPGDRISSGTEVDQDQEQQAVNINEDSGDIQVEDEGLPADINTSNDAESFQAVVERINPDIDSNCAFRKILDHCWKEGTLIMKAQYSDEIQGCSKLTHLSRN